MDAVEKAQSGHPGAPMGLADIAEVLWNDFLKHNPKNPKWLNRDRFILSNGHGSLLLYSLLHLSGYDLPLEELKNFRQLHSKTPGHPEHGLTPGVETTTGPLGQGVANAVGMALAEKRLAAEFNRENFSIIDHYTYAIVGDGCLMEGISHEVCSLAGTLKLGKLIVFYDSNGISIDGKTAGWFTDDTTERFQAYGWQVIPAIDGHDREAVKVAVMAAQSNHEQPTLIVCNTIIGFGAPTKAGSHHSHGAPLGKDEIAKTRENLNWPYPAFEIPEAIKEAWDARERGTNSQKTWDLLFSKYQQAYPELAQELSRRTQGKPPENWDKQSQQFIDKALVEQTTMATRKASLTTLEAYKPLLPELLGGSADLTDSNLTRTSGDEHYIHYGVREFGMSAIMNGIALYGGFIPYGGTFLTFSDYARNAVRMAALMEQRVIFVYTHDSIGLGEDGPTHQSIEHLASLRLIPNMSVWRPCDLAETAVAWKYAIEHHNGPTCLVLSRQNILVKRETVMPAAALIQANIIAKGGYIFKDCDGEPQAVIIATGSELPLAVEAAELLAKQWRIRVVSMPCCEVFNKQPQAYKDSVLPPSLESRIAIEAGASAGWYRYTGLKGLVFGIDSFGASAPGNIMFEAFGFATDQIAPKIEQYLQTFYGEHA